MNLGFVPLALQFAVTVASWMLKSRVNAATAAQYAAAEFDYFKRVSDGELTAIAFEMAGKFPEYPYWEWFRILEDLRSYGMLQAPPGPAQPPGPARPPAPGETQKEPEAKKASLATWLTVGILAMVFVAISER